MPQYDDSRASTWSGPCRLPDPGPGGQRASAGLPRPRQHLTEAAAGHRRHARALQLAQRQRGPLGAHAGHRGDRLRGRAGEGGRVHQRAQPRGGGVHQELHRGDQPGGALVSRAATGPRFRLGPGDEIVISEMEHHSNIVPWQLSVSAQARRCAGSASPTRAASTSPSRRAHQRAHQDRLVRAHLEHPRHRQRHVAHQQPASARSVRC